ncbi:MAG: hypothetical protein JXR25_04805 [Pontiellaceae bacterium]|nr:hypothetical protein [Pontiellaceae bacterium]MBN2784126.1 hypothetical protein [Pontiellaceae bacterium]
MKTTIMLCGILFSVAALASPVNDDFTNALIITGSMGSSEIIDNTLASAEPGEPEVAGYDPVHTLWWEYTAPTHGTLIVDTLQSDPGLDTVMGVYTGSYVGALQEVAYNDDSDFDAEGLSWIKMNVSSGVTYRVAVDGYGGAVGDIVLSWIAMPEVSPVPAHDDFTNALEITENTGMSPVIDTALATAEPGEPTHGGSGGYCSVWWKYTPMENGVLDINTTASDPDLDTVLAVYTGSSVSNLIEVASNDDNDPLDEYRSQLSFVATAGETYWIAADGYRGDTGFLVFRWEWIVGSPAPANDDFAHAIPITGPSGMADPVDTTYATAEPGEPAHVWNDAAHSVWWQYTAPSNAMLIASLEGSGDLFDTVMGVYTGNSVSNLTEVTSNDDDSDLSYRRHSRVYVPVDSGTTYWIAVDGYDFDTGVALLSWETVPLDADGDGANYYDELIAGTDPDDAESLFRITGFNGVDMEFESLSSREYGLFRCTNLTEGIWVPVGESQLGVDGEDAFTLSPTNPVGYYRIEVVR